MSQVKDVRRPHADVLAGCAVIAFCTLVYAATYTFDDVSAVISQGMGPEAFPRLVLAVMAFLGTLLAWRSRGRVPAASEPVPGIVIYTASLLFAGMLLATIIGMLVAMLLLMVAMGWLWGERRLLPLCTAAVLLCLAVWGIFVRGFGVPLPSGLAARLIS